MASANQGEVCGAWGAGNRSSSAVWRHQRGIREVCKAGVKEKKRLAVKGTQESAPGMRSSRCKGLAAGARDPVEHPERG